MTVTLQTGAPGDLVLSDQPGRQHDRAAIVGAVTDWWRAIVMILIFGHEHAS